MSSHFFNSDIVWKNIQTAYKLLGTKGGLLITTSLLPITEYSCVSNVITQFIVAFMSSFTVI